MTESRTTDGSSMKCLLIDDDIDDQEIFHMALQELSNSVDCQFAADGVNALETLTRDELFLPHCIFIDVNMPRMNGVECLAQIKKINRLRNVPVCMYSTSADPSLVAKAKSLGAVDFIVKPADMSELGNLLSRFFVLNGILNER